MIIGIKLYFKMLPSSRFGEHFKTNVYNCINRNEPNIQAKK